jgi:central glycolytic genes regulator
MGAVAEALGYYFNRVGDINSITPTMGLKFNDVKDIKNIIAIAGGKNKAEAIIALKTQNPRMVLITDESAAKEIIRVKEASKL